jgi:ribose 5-phosphate isomerase B
MIYVGADHGGFDLKKEIVEYIKNELKLEIEDLGCYSKDSVDYPDFAKTVSEKVLSKKDSLGILVCSTGIGISIAANKIKGIRCALCSEEFSAEMSRRHNNANVLALGGKTLGSWHAKSIVEAFIFADFDGGERHERRVGKIADLDGFKC